jgi:hypothetical protein
MRCFWSLRPNGLPASDPMGLWNEVRTYWPRQDRADGVPQECRRPSLLSGRFFFGTCAGRRSNFFSSPSDCRCALSDFARFFAMSIVCSAFVLNASAARQRRFHPGDGSEVDKQVATPTETRTPNWHRANHRSSKSADGRMAAEAARLRQNRTGRKSLLTLTGFLMEGVYTQNSQ